MAPCSWAQALPRLACERERRSFPYAGSVPRVAPPAQVARAHEEPAHAGRLLPRRHVVPAAAAGAGPKRGPASGPGSVPGDQARLNLVDLAGLDREELGDDTVERGHRARVFDRAVEPAETQNREHDAALLVDDRIAAVPEIAPDEAAAVETFRGDRIDAVAIVAGELRAVLETPRIRQEVRAVVIRCAVGLERSEIPVRDGDELVIGIALGRWDRELQKVGRLRVELLRSPPRLAGITAERADDLHLGDRALHDLEAHGLHRVGAVLVDDHDLSARVAEPLVHDIEPPADFLCFLPEGIGQCDFISV